MWTAILHCILQLATPKKQLKRTFKKILAVYQLLSQFFIVVIVSIEVP